MKVLTNISLIVASMLIGTHTLPSFAAVAGMPCEKSEIGKTEMDDNKKNIIGCLITDDGECQIWKNMTAPLIPTTCGNNQLLMSDKSGRLWCAEMACRIVSNEYLGGPPYNYLSVATCDDDEFLLNGGGFTHPKMGGGCPFQRIGILHTSRPLQNLNSWQADAFGFREWPSLELTAPASESCTVAYATCCRWIQPQ